MNLQWNKDNTINSKTPRIKHVGIELAQYSVIT